MGHGGQSRKRIERRLSLAYASGLLSEDTYAGRVHELLSAAVVDPTELAGDLNLRAADRASLWEIGEVLAAPISRVRARLSGDRSKPKPDAMLALDWTGATSELSVGRSQECDVVFPEGTVSRRHVRLRFRDGRWILQDLASRNGSWVNGVRVGRSELRPGDVLMLGDTRLLVD